MSDVNESNLLETNHLDADASQASSQSLMRLVACATSADAQAFAQLVRKYEKTALAIAYAVVGEASSAADVTQDAFLKAWQRIEELKDPQRFGAWLARIVRNTAHDHLRRRPRRECVPVERCDVAQANDGRLVVDPLAQLGRRELKRGIDAALSQLDELTRSAVVLRYYEGMASKEIGELLDLSPAAIDMRLSRARTQLKQLLAPLAPAKC